MRVRLGCIQVLIEMHHNFIILTIYFKEGVRCRLNRRGKCLSVLKLKWVRPSYIQWIQPFFFFYCSTSLIELCQQCEEKKKSGARAEKESVWEAYWLVVPGGKDHPHHTSLQHLPQGIHLNVIWQPSAISKLNLDIDWDIQFQHCKTPFTLSYAQPDAAAFVLLRVTPAEALHTERREPLLPVNTSFLLVSCCSLCAILYQLFLVWPPHKVRYSFEATQPLSVPRGFSHWLAFSSLNFIMLTLHIK